MCNNDVVGTRCSGALSNVSVSHANKYASNDFVMDDNAIDGRKDLTPPVEKTAGGLEFVLCTRHGLTVTSVRDRTMHVNVSPTV